MNVKKKLSIIISVSIIMLSCIACENKNNDEDTEESGVHKPKDDYKETGNVNRLEDEPKDK